MPIRLALSILFLALLPAFGQPAYYPFAIDQDRLAGVADFSWLNRPLAAADTLYLRDGHFTRVGEDLALLSDDDERIRLFGVNLCFGANFPDAADAQRIARRIARLGVNLVRLHHMDSQPDRDPNNAGSILTTGRYPSLNPVAVVRLRRFLDALKSEGIYVNVNLHVGYTFRPDVDGVPPLPAGAAFPSQSKPLHIVHPRMVELQADYARRLLDALSLRHDPVLAMVEIDNESSLVREWQAGNLDRWLAGEYKAEFGRQWNAFLSARYGATEALRKAWGATEPDGNELLPGRWVIEKGPPSDGAFELLQGAETPTLRMVVTSPGPRLVLKQVGFSVEAGRSYVAEFDARIDAPAGLTRVAGWDVKQDVSPWNTVVSRQVTLSDQWQRYRFSFVPAFAMNGVGRFGLYIQSLDRPLYVRNWSLRAAGRRGLSAGEALENAGVELVGENDIATAARLDDYLTFLAARDRFYLDTVLKAVRESAGPLVPVAGTQMGYGGLLNLDSHDGLDYQDNHFYVDHYNFPNTRWDGRDWRIRDTSAVAEGLSAFRGLAIARQAGRPYTVSEFNQPWPNTHAAEIDPALSAFGVFQDWDSIIHFAYSHGRNWDAGVPNGFNLNGDWSKFVNIGQSAWIFRSDALSPGEQFLDIPVTVAMRLRAAREKRNANIAGFLEAAGYQPLQAFLHPVRLVKDGTGPMPEAACRKPDPPYTAATGDFTYDPERKLFLIHSPRAAGVIGFAGQAKVAAGDIEVELAPSARGFAAILVTPFDQVPLPESECLLLSTPGYALRTQPGSNPPRPQELTDYPGTTDWWTVEKEPAYPDKPSGDLNGGSGPVWMERVESYVTIRTKATAIAVYPLDGSGVPLDRLPDRDVQRVADGFRIHLQAEGQALSPWYQIIALRE